MVFAKDRGTTDVLLPVDTQRDKEFIRAGTLRGLAKPALGEAGRGEITEKEALSHPIVSFISLFYTCLPTA